MAYRSDRSPPAHQRTYRPDYYRPDGYRPSDKFPSYSRPRRDSRDQDAHAFVDSWRDPRSRSNTHAHSTNGNVDGVGSIRSTPSDATPRPSPRSPLITNDHNAKSSDRDQSKVSKPEDPRHAFRLANMLSAGTNTAATETNTNASIESAPTNAMADFLSTLVRQAILADRLAQGELRFKVIKDEENEFLKRHSNSKDLKERRSSRLKGYQTELDNLDRSISESKRAHSQAANALPPAMKNFFHGIVPETPPANGNDAPSRSDFDALLKKIDILEQRDASRGAELMRLQSKQAEFESSVQLAVLESKATSVDENKKLLDQHSKLLDSQTGAIKSITKRMVSLKNDTSTRSPTPQLDTALAELQKKVREHESSLANLANTFVPQQAYNGHVDELSEVKSAQVTLQSNLQKTDQDVKALRDELQHDHSVFTSDIQKIQSSVQTMQAEIHEPQRIGNANASMESIFVKREDFLEVRRRIDELAQLSKQQEAAAPLSLSTPKLVADDEYQKLRRTVEKLDSFTRHYEDFYRETKKDLKTHDDMIAGQNGGIERLTEQQKTSDKAMSDSQTASNSTASRHDHIINALCRQVEALEKRPASTPAQVEKTIAERFKVMQDKNDEFSKKCDIVMDNRFGMQVDIMKKDIASMHVLIAKTDHSIQSLSARYNAMTTQDLYRGVIAAIVPMGPKITELEVAAAQLLHSFAQYESRETSLKAEIEALREKIGSKQSQLDDALYLKVAELEEVTSRLSHGLEQSEGRESTMKQDIEKAREHFTLTPAQPDGELYNKLAELGAFVKRLNEREQPEISAADAQITDLREKCRDLDEKLTEMSTLLDETCKDMKTNRETCDARQQELDANEGTAERQSQQIKTLQDSMKTIQTDIQGNAEKQSSLDVRLRAREEDPEISRSLQDIDERVKVIEYNVQSIMPIIPSLEGSVEKIWESMKVIKNNQAVNGAADASITRLASDAKELELCFHPGLPGLDVQEKASLSTYLHHSGNSFLLLKAISTKTDEDEIRQKFAHYAVRNVWIRGKKNDKAAQTTRQALVEVKQKDAIKLKAFFESLPEEEQKSHGRMMTVVIPNERDIKRMLTGIPESDPDHWCSRDRTSAPVAQSMAPPPAEREVLESDDGDTLVINTPHAKETEMLLRAWNAHSGPRSGPAPPRPSVSSASRSRNVTPAAQASPSRNGLKRSSEEHSRSNSVSRPKNKKGKPS